MSNFEKFIRYNLIKYIMSYSYKLQNSPRATSFKTLNFLFEVANLVGVHYSDSDTVFLNFEKKFIEMEDEYSKFLDGISVNVKISEDETNCKDEEDKVVQAVSRRIHARELKHKLRNQNISQDLVSKYLARFHKISNEFISENIEEVPENFREIFSLFQLSSEEVELLKFIFIAERCPLLYQHVIAYDDSSLKRYELNYSELSSRKSKDMHIRIEYILNIRNEAVRKNLKENSKLFLTGLLEDEDDPSISDYLTDYIEGESKENFLKNILEVVDLENAFPLTSNQASEKELLLIERMLNSKIGISILLKGKPGTGKTELVKSIAKKVGMPLFSLHHSRKKTDSTIPPRKMVLYLVQQLYGNKNAIFLVDECEDLINSLPSLKFSRGKSEDENLKSFINEYLDENKCKFFFVANNTEDVDESTMRRFNYILTFNNVSNDHRETLLKSLFRKEQINFFSDEELKTLAFSSKLNIGHFGLALTTTKNLDVEESFKKECFLDILNNHSKEFLGTELSLKQINNSYSLNGLNTDHDLNKVCNQLIKYRKMILGSDSDTSINLLLCGPPGTGKTEFAKYLSSELNIGFVFKQASDLKNKYVGDTEKNIRNAFLEAQNTNCVLFIDEIDTFLHNRDNAHHSWEISEVNEFLVCLENFRGIFICATNSTDRMDPASLRRFLFKIKFDYLNASGVMCFYNSFFQKLMKEELNIEQRDELVKIKSLTPSDFNSVKRKIILESEDLTHEKIIALLRQEVAYKKHHSKGAIGLINKSII